MSLRHTAFFVPAEAEAAAAPALYPLRRLWTKQPNRFVSLDRSNPITAGLGVVYNGALRDTDHALMLGGVSGLQTRDVSQYTIGSRISSGRIEGENDKRYALGIAAGNMFGNDNADEFTVLWLGTVDDVGIAGAFVHIAETPGASQNNGIALGIAVSNDLRIRCRTPGGLDQVSWVSAPMAGDSLVIARVSSTKSPDLWLNGVSGGSVTGNTFDGGFTIGTDLDFLSIGSSLDTVPGNFDGSSALACIWNRWLTDWELQSLFDNPDQIWERRTIWMPLGVEEAAAGAAVLGHLPHYQAHLLQGRSVNV